MDYAQSVHGCARPCERQRGCRLSDVMPPLSLPASCAAQRAPAEFQRISRGKADRLPA